MSFDDTLCDCGHTRLFHPRSGPCLAPVNEECGCLAFSMWDPRSGWVDVLPVDAEECA